MFTETISSYTMISQWRPVACVSSPVPSTVASRFVPVRFTTKPFSSVQRTDCVSGFSYSTSGYNSFNNSLLSNSVLIAFTISIAARRDQEQIPIVISGSCIMFQIVIPWVIIEVFPEPRNHKSSIPSGCSCTSLIRAKCQSVNKSLRLRIYTTKKNKSFRPISAIMTRCSSCEYLLNALIIAGYSSLELGNLKSIIFYPLTL